MPRIPISFANMKKYVIESLLIFIGLMGAFLVDNMRVNYEERQNYRKSVLEFQIDLAENLSKFNHEISLDSDRNYQVRAGFLKTERLYFDSLNALIDSSNFDQVLTMITRAEVLSGMFNWVNQSGVYEKLTDQYSKFIETPELRKTIWQYKRSISSRDDAIDQLNSSVYRLRIYLEDLNCRDISDPDNYVLLAKPKFQGIVKRCLINYQSLELYNEDLYIPRFTKLNNMLNEEVKGW